VFENEKVFEFGLPDTLLAEEVEKFEASWYSRDCMRRKMNLSS
jgi:hypothetical protein